MYFYYYPRLVVSYRLHSNLLKEVGIFVNASRTITTNPQYLLQIRTKYYLCVFDWDNTKVSEIVCAVSYHDAIHPKNVHIYEAARIRNLPTASAGRHHTSHVFCSEMYLVRYRSDRDHIRSEIRRPDYSLGTSKPDENHSISLHLQNW